jgi:AraC-like DNA-binding protein
MLYYLGEMPRISVDRPTLDRRMRVAATTFVSASVRSGRLVDIREAADACRVSARTLQRAFEGRRSGEPSFKGAVAEARMQEARRLLRSHRSVTVSEVAARVGYRDVAQFTQTFRRRFGRTPARERHAAGGRVRGGSVGGAAVSRRARRERRRARRREALYREAELLAAAEVYALSSSELEAARSIGEVRGVRAMRAWVRASARGEGDGPAGESRRESVLLEASVVLAQADRLRELLSDAVGEGA